MDKVCVILGAGASHDVHNGSSPITREDLRPPLSKDLFDIHAHPAYANIIEPYEGARLIAANLAPVKGTGELSIEQELARFARHPDKRVRQRFNHVPPYLRDLIYQTSVAFTPDPGCYLHLVTELMANFPHEILFLVLNYDDLLDRALVMLDGDYRFTAIDQYVQPKRQANVVKLHGSINWFFKFPTDKVLGWEDLVLRLDLTKKPQADQIIVTRYPKPSMRGEQVNDQWLYPVVTAPLAGKNVDDMVCPDAHVDFARGFIKECRKFLVMGTSGLDLDLIHLLDSNIDPRTEVALDVVGMKEGANACLGRLQAGVRAFGLLTPGPLLRVQDRGFQAYMRERAIVPFLQRQLAAVRSATG